MYLKAIKFCRFKNEKHEWSIEGKPINGIFDQSVTFENINLIVGKNATGKSKTISCINQLAELLSGETKTSQLFYNTATYQLMFDNEGTKISYDLEFKDGKIIQEKLIIGEDIKLNRSEKKLYYEEVQKELSFEMEEDKLAISRVDTKQQPFFEPLYNWGKNLKRFRFGEDMGKTNFLRNINNISEENDFKNEENEVAEIFIIGKKKYPDKFVSQIIEDMKNIDYDINEIDAFPINFFPIQLFGLGANEKGIDATTDQREMSQGMFRALSLLVQINYFLLAKIPSCILIDDIGEGLDFDRSKKLIDLIINKIQNSNVQIIMTTNDRYVMNEIRLEYWSVIQRIAKKSLFYNYRNSRDTFEDFKFTGLSNFDFLATEFYIEGFENQ